MPFPYKNREYIDHIETFLTDTVLEGVDRVTLPQKMLIGDMALLISGIFNGATLIVEYSPDQMETPAVDLVPSTMTWFSRPDGSFTAADLTFQTLWENLDAAEGWMRFRIINVVAETDLKVKTRPRVEKAI